MKEFHTYPMNKQTLKIQKQQNINDVMLPPPQPTTLTARAGGASPWGRSSTDIHSIRNVQFFFRLVTEGIASDCLKGSIHVQVFLGGGVKVGDVSL